MSPRDSRQARWCFLSCRPPRSPSRSLHCLCENLRGGPGERLSTADPDGLVQAIEVIHQGQIGVRDTPEEQVSVPVSDRLQVVAQPDPREHVSLPIAIRQECCIE
jgi:hypothetical protein